MHYSPLFAEGRSDVRYTQLLERMERAFWPNETKGRESIRKVGNQVHRSETTKAGGAILKD